MRGWARDGGFSLSRRDLSLSKGWQEVAGTPRPLLYSG